MRLITPLERRGRTIRNKAAPTGWQIYARASPGRIVIVYIKSRKYLLSTRLVTARTTTAPMIMAKIEGSKTLVDMPKTVPAAGGCSVSVIAIRTIIAPTDAARAKSRSAPTPSRMLLTSGANRTSENTDPTSRARKWPPNSALGATDLLVG